MAGIILDQAFPVFPDGFPPEIIEPFELAVGRSVLGNIKASGTEIIELLGREHIESGSPIVYTSADSVFQIAAHEMWFHCRYYMNGAPPPEACFATSMLSAG
jgi:phosphopentomutase